MDDTTASISIKVGVLEINCQAKQEFLKNDLIHIMGDMFELCNQNSDMLAINPASNTNVVDREENGGESKKQCLDMTTETIAARLDAKTGTDLTIAAAAHLIFMTEKDRFTRKELLEEMKTASSYYRNSYSSNLSKTIKTLIKNKRFIANNNSYFTLSATEKELLRKKIED